MNRYPENNIQKSHADAKQNQNVPAESGVKIDGLQQVVELLKYADPSFRESLLKRLTQRDPALAQQLRKLYR